MGVAYPVIFTSTKDEKDASKSVFFDDFPNSNSFVSAVDLDLDAYRKTMNQKTECITIASSDRFKYAKIAHYDWQQCANHDGIYDAFFGYRFPSINGRNFRMNRQIGISTMMKNTISTASVTKLFMNEK